MEVFLFSGEGKNFINIIPKAETIKSKRLINLYAGQEATVRTGHGKTDWFQIGMVLE